MFKLYLEDMKNPFFISCVLFSGIILMQVDALHANDNPDIGQNAPETTTSAVNSSNVGTTGQNGSTAVDTSAQNQANGTTSLGSSDNILNYGNDITDTDLRTGNLDMDDIPKILVSIINVLLGVAGTISIVALIYYAIQMQINSGITGDSSGVDNAKKGMRGALLGFIVAILAWFIVIRFIEILSGLS